MGYLLECAISLYQLFHTLINSIYSPPPIYYSMAYHSGISSEYNIQYTQCVWYITLYGDGVCVGMFNFLMLFDALSYD